MGAVSRRERESTPRPLVEKSNHEYWIWQKRLRGEWEIREENKFEYTFQRLVDNGKYDEGKTGLTGEEGEVGDRGWTGKGKSKGVRRD